MLTAAWVIMGITVLMTILLLGDVRREMKYNSSGMINEYRNNEERGTDHGLQETAYREGREFLRRCC